MHFLEGVRHEAPDDQAEALVDPERYEEHAAGRGEKTFLPAELRKHEDHERCSRKDGRRPHELYQLGVALKPDIEVHERRGMARDAAVEGSKKLQTQKEDVGQ